MAVGLIDRAMQDTEVAKYEEEETTEALEHLDEVEDC
jgi:hypothetical protein